MQGHAGHFAMFIVILLSVPISNFNVQGPYKFSAAIKAILQWPHAILHCVDPIYICSAPIDKTLLTICWHSNFFAFTLSSHARYTGHYIFAVALLALCTRAPLYIHVHMHVCVQVQGCVLQSLCNFQFDSIAHCTLQSLMWLQNWNDGVTQFQWHT